MKYNRAKSIDLYASDIIQGKMTFSDTRKRLQEANVEADEIDIVVKQVNKQVQRYTEMKAIHSLGKNQYYGGLLVALGGVLLSGGTYLGLIDLGNYFLIAYGPIIGGVILALYGKSQMNRQ